MENYKNDWPLEKEIDLNIHDLPHPLCATEWWYVNTHITTSDKRNISIFASFFKFFESIDPKTKVRKYAYFLTWAMSDNTNKTYHAFSNVDKGSPSIALELIKNIKNKKLRDALHEVYKKGNVPLPDQLFKQQVKMSETELHLEFDDNAFIKKNGMYQLKLYDEKRKIGCELEFSPLKPPIRHGENGVVKGTSDEDMFYYFIPSCKVTGSVIENDQKIEVVKGMGWYDHEFGGDSDEKGIKNTTISTGWNWIAIQLNNNYQVSAYNLIEIDTNKSLGQLVVIIDPEGKRTSFKDFSFQPIEDKHVWRSHQTFNTYPTNWILKVPEANIELEITANFDQQEFITFIIPTLGFWEGACQVKGKFDAKEVSGAAYVERHGYSIVKNVEDFFTSVSTEVIKQIRSLIPFNPTTKEWYDLIAVNDSKDILNDVDFNQLSEKLIKPIRMIADRRGKAWRPYALLACCNAVGGKFEKYLPLLAIELIHVGSLIVDDVEDNSELRRGESSAHIIFGEAIALNAGSTAYFIPQVLFNKLFHDLPYKTQCKIYDLYFEAIRAAHAGQALDLSANDTLVSDIINKTASPDLLEKRLLAIHRLKSGAPAGVLARIGSILGNGSPEQTNVLGDYMETLGVAFQIIDDVLNLRGFENNSKVRGEDIADGKITFPIAKASNLLGIDEYCKLLTKVKSKPKDPQEIALIINKLEECGALDSASSQAKDMIEAAWTNLDPVIEDSLSKIMLRVFGYHVIERHY